MTQARFSGPRGSALQFSANAVDENAADKPINAKPILSVVITGLVSISAVVIVDDDIKSLVVAVRHNRRGPAPTHRQYSTGATPGI